MNQLIECLKSGFRALVWSKTAVVSYAYYPTTWEEEARRLAAQVILSYIQVRLAYERSCRYSRQAETQGLWTIHAGNSKGPVLAQLIWVLVPSEE